MSLSRGLSFIWKLVSEKLSNAHLHRTFMWFYSLLLYRRGATHELNPTHLFAVQLSLRMKFVFLGIVVTKMKRCLNKCIFDIIFRYPGNHFNNQTLV